MPRERLSPAEARRAAIAAQGLHGGAPRMDVVSAVRRMGILQIDSVNVLARAHLLTLRSRLGAFGPDALARAAYGGRRRRLFEYWGHEASFLPVESHALWRWRMRDAERGAGIYSGLARLGREQADLIDTVAREVESRGPVTAGELGGPGKGSWWGWSDAKTALEWLFWTGRVTTAERRGNFERVYELSERVLPRAALEAPAPPRAEAQATLLARALAAHGVATTRDLRDYCRLPAADMDAALAVMRERGDALPVTVTGWPETWMAPGLRVPRATEACRLLCPFDPLVWTRERTERLFGMRYRIEIYVPEAERVHGYYVLPFLLDDALVGRVDLKADRASGTLVVRAAHAEPGCPPHAPEALMAELRDLGGWLGCPTLRVEPRGSLAAALGA